MSLRPLTSLSRRERQIMDAVFEREEASALEIQAALPDAPGYSAVRTLLKILERKGHLRHREEKGRHIFYPTHPREEVGRVALGRVLKSFYRGSVEQAVAGLLDAGEAPLTDEQVERLEALIELHRTKDRRR